MAFDTRLVEHLLEARAVPAADERIDLGASMLHGQPARRASLA